MSKPLLFKAEKHNWDEIEPGSWVKVTWFIFYDRSFKIVVEFEDYSDDSPSDNNKRLSSGVMDERSFMRLKKLLRKRKWKNLFIDCYSRDGSAWKMSHYSLE